MTELKPATPLPWETIGEPIADAIIGHKQTTPMAYIGHPENAAYIVTAANAYPRLMAERRELVEALRHLEQAYSNSHSPQHRANALGSARALLARIEGGK